ncbi:multidrug effflux MFS transporter [Corynebacterium pygosceleis]|uniref:Multidrug effflux MFS transporter n=1 Tax=Corynebacterium pygosceleis TaxID=2800406 RepID=A0A9Q4GKC4_9CORY|nr:multidrug effflux MFS transporter [Corynebacterium pygosceleis]MCK7638376.1 multidrug effflux MFS transporter [Corynebacterium pygosceleis]MCK7675356.1 multidrug effflux MFS transporter [Corynebacterium pygosceleis]MCL0121250.1 multidrug effflux MFS transporter [Corynebacterium pygosceleis]MCX7445465.1 multidrug effflux MFS transporter [Corynebacterium pygosceleis]MCX7469039.1 multidrug effflux MFS transporter [Corynebacterium pygosceleis]
MRPELGVGLLAALALMISAGPFAIDMYLPALPTLRRDLGATTVGAQLTLTTFMVGMAVGQLITGPLSDVTGRRPPLIAATVLSVVCAVASALAPSVGVLVAVRAVMGLANGACVVLARAIVADLAEGRRAAQAYSLLMAMMGIAPVVAPLTGGLLVEPIGWRGLFWILAAIATVQVIVALLVVGESKPRGPGGGGWRTFTSGVRVVASTRLFTAYTVGFAAAAGVLFGYIAAGPLVFIDHFGMSPRMYAVVFAVNSVALVTGSLVNSRLVRRFEPLSVLRAAGCVVLCCGLVLLGDAVLSGGRLPVVLVTLFVALGHMPGIFGNATALGVSAVRSHAGLGSAVMGFCQFLVAGAVSPLVGLGDDPVVALGLVVTVSVGLSLCGTLVADVLTRRVTGERR